LLVVMLADGLAGQSDYLWAAEKAEM